MSSIECNSETVPEYAHWEIFSKRVPKSSLRYCLILGRDESGIMFYSRGVAWDENSETRAARPVNSASVIQYYNAKKIPVLVLETSLELDMWVRNWNTVALVELSTWEDLEKLLD